MVLRTVHLDGTSRRAPLLCGAASHCASKVCTPLERRIVNLDGAAPCAPRRCAVRLDDVPIVHLYDALYTSAERHDVHLQAVARCATRWYCALCIAHSVTV